MQAQPIRPPASDPANRWLFGPTTDLVLGCGLGYAWIFVALAVFDVRFVEAIPAGFLPLALLVSATPHYGATLLRVYEQRESRRAYALFSVWITGLLAAAFVISLEYLALGSLLMTVYFNWNPWHYGGQNYGLAVMFLRRRNVEITPLAKRLLYASFVLSALLAIIEMNGVIPGALYAPVGSQSAARSVGPFYQFVSLGIPPALQRNLTSVGLAAYVGTLVGAGALLLRRGSLADLGPSAALVATQSLWFVIPGAARVWGVLGDWVPFGGQHFNYAFIWVAVGHSVQYLWVTTYYARRTGPGSQLGARFGGFPRYYAKCILAGAVLWNFPALVFAPGILGSIGYNDGLFLLIASVANLHHFVLDGAIWKLRDSKIAGVLIRSGAPAAAAPAVEPRRRWIRPVVWAIGSVCIVAFVVGTWEREVGFRQSSLHGDYSRIERASTRLGWIGQQDAAIHRYLGAMSQARRNPEQAIREYDASLRIREHPKAYFELGVIYADRGDWDAAERAFEGAYRLDPSPVPLIVRLSQSLIETGRVERAREVLNEGLARHPGQPALVEQLRRVGGVEATGERSTTSYSVPAEGEPAPTRSGRERGEPS